MQPASSLHRKPDCSITLWWIHMKRSVMLCLLVLLWCHWCYCWCFVTSCVPAMTLLPCCTHSSHHSLLIAHLSHLGPTASLVLQWVAPPVQATERWCVLYMPNVWICCNNFSELALFLLCPSFSSALLLGWSCSWWMDFSVLEQLASMCKEQNHFPEQALSLCTLCRTLCLELSHALGAWVRCMTEDLQPCTAVVSSMCMLPLVASWALIPVVSWAGSQQGFLGAVCTQSFSVFTLGHSKGCQVFCLARGGPSGAVCFFSSPLLLFLLSLAFN